MRSVLMLGSIVIFLCGSSAADGVDLWFGGAGGISTEGTAVAGNFNLVADPGVMLTFTFDHAWDRQGDADFKLFSDERHTESFTDIGLMVGYLHKFSDTTSGSISFQIGIADASITRNGKYIENTFLFGPYWEKLEYSETSFLISAQFHYRRFYFEFRDSANSFESAMSILFGCRIGRF